jgi:uncharacterized membrane protein
MAHAHTTAHDGALPASPATRRLLAALLAPFLVATVVGLVVLWPGGAEPRAAPGVVSDELVDARVVAEESGPCTGVPPGEGEVTCARYSVRLDEGPDRGRTVELPEQPEGVGSLDLDVSDDIILSYVADAEPDLRYAFADRERRRPLLLLAGIFAVAVVVLGRFQGVRALVGLGVSLFVLTQFVLPAVLEGSSPVVVALVGSSAIAFVALYLAHGVNAGTTTALLGTLSSLVLVGVLASVFVAAAELSGFATEEVRIVQLGAEDLNVRGLLLAGMVIGALGVLDDVTVTQVAAVAELRRADPTLPVTGLYRAAVRIGRDHIASTVNTLVLAYAGASLPLLLLFTQARQGFLDVVNGEVVAVEIVRTLTGSIGLVACVPITTALAALVVTRRGELKGRGSGRRRAGRVRSRGEERFWRGSER